MAKKSIPDRRSALLRALAFFEGNQSEFARALDVKQAHIWHWLKKGLPAGRALAVAAAVEWSVTPHELDPDNYPNPDDGLPPERRGERRTA